MSEENKALVRRFVEEFWNEGNIAAVDKLMAIDAVIHMPTGRWSILMGSKGSSPCGVTHSLTGTPPSRI